MLAIWDIAMQELRPVERDPALCNCRHQLGKSAQHRLLPHYHLLCCSAPTPPQASAQSMQTPPPPGQAAWAPAAARRVRLGSRSSLPQATAMR